jgi:hypothetical protein
MAAGMRVVVMPIVQRVDAGVFASCIVRTLVQPSEPHGSLMLPASRDRRNASTEQAISSLSAEEGSDAAMVSTARNRPHERSDTACARAFHHGNTDGF